VTWFVVQLEYLYEGNWTTVVRYDPDPASKQGHDVTDEGLHIDVYSEGEKYRTEYVAPPMPAGVVLDFAEDHFAENAQFFFQKVRVMARDQEPMTDEELEEFRDAMDEQSEELREALAEDLGGDPDDYRKRPVADGGE